MLDFQKDRLRNLVANAILELWKKETGSTTAVYIEGTLCITAKNGKTTIVQVADQFPGSIPEEDDAEGEETCTNGIPPFLGSSPVKTGRYNCDTTPPRNSTKSRHVVEGSPANGRHLTDDRSPKSIQFLENYKGLTPDYCSPTNARHVPRDASPSIRKRLTEVNTGNYGRAFPESSQENHKPISDGSLDFAIRKLSSQANMKRTTSREGLALPSSLSSSHRHMSPQQQGSRSSEQGNRQPSQRDLENNNNRDREKAENTVIRQSRSSFQTDITEVDSKAQHEGKNAPKYSKENDGCNDDDDVDDVYDDDDSDEEEEHDGDYDYGSNRDQNDSGISGMNNSTFESNLMKESCKRSPVKRHLEDKASMGGQLDTQPHSTVSLSHREADLHLLSPNSYTEQVRDAIKRRLLSTMNTSLIPLGLPPFGFHFPSSGAVPSSTSPFPSAADIFQNSRPSYGHLASTPAMNCWSPMAMAHPAHNSPGAVGMRHMGTPFSSPPSAFNQSGHGEHNILQSPPMRQHILSPPDSLHQILAGNSRSRPSPARRRHSSAAHKSERTGGTNPAEDSRERGAVDSRGSSENLDQTGEQKVYRCDQCYKTFLFKSKYLEHLPVHTSARPFQCHLCSRTYKYKYDLRVHLRAHLGIPTKSTVCPFCAEKFGTNKQLRQHIHEAHKEQQAIGEDQCAKSLEQIAALNAARSNSDATGYDINLAERFADENVKQNLVSPSTSKVFQDDDVSDTEDGEGAGDVSVNCDKQEEEEKCGNDKQLSAECEENHIDVDVVGTSSDIMSVSQKSASVSAERLEAKDSPEKI